MYEDTEIQLPESGGRKPRRVITWRRLPEYSALCVVDHMFHTYLLSIYYVPGAILKVMGTMRNKKDKVLFMEVSF